MYAALSAAALKWIQDNDYFKHQRLIVKERECVRLVAWVEEMMNNQELDALRQLTGTEGLKVPWDEIRNKLKGMQNDSLAVAMNAFFDAMKKYRNRHKEEFMTPFSEYEKVNFPDKVDLE